VAVDCKMYFRFSWDHIRTLEASSEPGRIRVSASIAAATTGPFVVEPRGQVNLKGKGSTETFFLVGRTAPADARPVALAGRHPPDSTVQVVGGDGGESNSPSRTLLRRPLRACPMVCRRPPERASAPCRAVQSRAPRSGLTPDYVTLVRIAAPLNDASTTRGAEVASTLTLLPKQRGRESTGGCQVLRFAA